MKVGSNSHCLLDNCKMIDGQSCGVNTSQIKKEEEFLSKNSNKYNGKWGMLIWFYVPLFKILDKNGHGSLHVFESAVKNG